MNYEPTEYTREDGVVLARISEEDQWVIRSAHGYYHYRIDEEAFLEYPDDLRSDRVCVEIDSGKVTKASMR